MTSTAYLTCTNLTNTNNMIDTDELTENEQQPTGLKQLLQNKYYSFQELEERKSWYSTAAKAYDNYRPKYKDEFIDEILEEASLLQSSENKVLEIGCGPGTATVSLAQRSNNSLQMTCLEPNQDFCDLARLNTLENSDHISIQCMAFEEYNTTATKSFDAVIAATCMHWIPPEVGFPKAAEALKPGGSLVLLWNMQLHPTSPQDLQKMVACCDGSQECRDVIGLGDEQMQLKMTNDVAQQMMASGLFEDLRTNKTRNIVTVSRQEYLGLLTTYSPYIRLDPLTRTKLMQILGQVIDEEMGGSIEMSYLSVYHIATKK